MQSKSSTLSDQNNLLVRELLAKINGKLHRVGYLSSDGKIITIQQIARELPDKTYYRAEDITSDCIYIIDENVCHVGSISLSEFAQLVALGVDPSRLESNVNSSSLEIDSRSVIRVHGRSFLVTSIQVEHNSYDASSCYLAVPASQLSLEAIELR